MKETAKMNIKVVKPRPALLQIESDTKFKVEEEHNLGMVLVKIRCSPTQGRKGKRFQEEKRGRMMEMISEDGQDEVTAGWGNSSQGRSERGDLRRVTARTRSK